MGNPGDLLIGSIGTSNYDEVVYELDGEKAKADVSPTALTKLCDIGQALIFRTPEAGEKNDHRLSEAFSAAGVDFELIDIGLIEEQEDVNKILQRIVDTTRSSRFREDSIILDISHSFRSIPIVFLLSVMQLTSLYENAALKKIYYSRFAGSSDHESSPVIDMTYLRTMIEWYDAFEMADQNGTYRGIRVLLEERKEEIWTDNESHPEGQNFSKAVGQFGAAQQAIDAGFPLEAGLKANVTLESISGLDEEAFVGPEGMVLNSLERLLNGFDTTKTLVINLN
ncbi:TM1812 family CRISPR-associated protein [Halonotius sp. GCM10025705]|uniref:TM1812 family CRISPR-associated protein n=1 Tax=Halonotius sp. GCM10025705 TaxID=3252678 RepID=UPI00361B5720